MDTPPLGCQRGAPEVHGPSLCPVPTLVPCLPWWVSVLSMCVCQAHPGLQLEGLVLPGGGQALASWTAMAAPVMAAPCQALAPRHSPELAWWPWHEEPTLERLLWAGPSE